MNSYERIMAAFRHEEADRVPITEFGVNPKVWQALGAKSLYEFQQQADYDGDRGDDAADADHVHRLRAVPAQQGGGQEGSAAQAGKEEVAGDDETPCRFV